MSDPRGSERTSALAWELSGATIGGYRLSAPIRRGGMGEVWSAVGPEGLPAAVKVLRSGPARGGRSTATAAERARRRFLCEIAVVAALDHPHLVEVFDHGLLEGPVGHLDAGSPWLAMELAAGDGRAVASEGWEGVRTLLVSVLLALAHGHAHGVLHRDVKPANVLLCRAGGGVRMKLSDYGLARTVGADDEPDRAGTPWAMAPEQFDGDVRSQGPWTDLYGVGCTAWSLACGEPPFSGADPSTLRDAHGRGVLPEFSPRIDVPEGFEDWIRALVRRDPASRPRFAADALAALRALGPAAPGRPVFGRLHAALPTISLEHLGALPEEFEVPEAREERLPPAPFSADEEAPPPMGWHPRGRLSTCGLRRPRLVGRDEERAKIRAQLGAVRRDGRARVVTVHGPPGIGRTALATWAGTRAHELGAASFGLAEHGEGALRSGLGPMLARLASVEGLAGEALLRALARRLPELDEGRRGILAEVIAPGGGAVPSPGDRRGAVVAALRLLADDRPLVLVLDDVDRGSEALGLALHLATNPADAPLLVVATARDGLDDPGWKRLCSLPEGVDLPLGRLSDPDQTRLVRGLVPLGGEPLAALVARTAGHPGFAVGIVMGWVARGALTSGRYGLVPDDDVARALPESLDALAAERLADLQARLTPADRRCLRVAAILGETVREEDWLAVCAARGLAPSPSLIPALLRTAFVVRVPDGLAFTQSLLREALIAESAAETEDDHRACAELLAPRTDGASRRRRALHLLRSGEPLRALELWLPLLRRDLDAWSIDVLAAEIPRLVEAVARSGLPEGDRRVCEARLLQAVSLHRQRSAREAVALATQTAEVCPDPDLAAELWMYVGYWHDMTLRPDDASEALARCRSLLRDDAPAVLRREVSWTLAESALRRGRTDEARAWFDRAEEAAAGDPFARAIVTIGRVALAEPEQRHALLDLAEAEYRRAGSALADLVVPVARADVCMRTGALAEAEQHLQRASAAPGAGWVRTTIALHLGLLRVLQGRPAEGIELFASSRRPHDVIWAQALAHALAGDRISARRATARAQIADLRDPMLDRYAAERLAAAFEADGLTDDAHAVRARFQAQDPRRQRE